MSITITSPIFRLWQQRGLCTICRETSSAAAAIYRSIIAFKAGAIWVGTFSGAPFTWSFQLISGKVGTFGQECVVTLPDSVAFLGATTSTSPRATRRSGFQTDQGVVLCECQYDATQNVCGWFDSISTRSSIGTSPRQSPSPSILDRYVAYNIARRTLEHGLLECDLS